jgi:hypothetical protein
MRPNPFDAVDGGERPDGATAVRTCRAARNAAVLRPGRAPTAVLKNRNASTYFTQVTECSIRCTRTSWFLLPK